MNTPPTPSDEPTPELPGFVIERRLDVAPGRAVWLGRDADGSQVMLMREPAGVDLAQRRTVSHPHLIACHDDLRSAAGDRFLVLDFPAGGSLAQLVTSRGKLGPGEVVTVLTPLAEAIAQLQAAGLRVGEICAGDVLFGEDGRPVLCDLGAPATENSADDVAALGAIGWFALTGRLPLPAATRVPLTILSPDAPLELTSLIERCVADAPSHRPKPGDLAVTIFDSCPPAAVRLMPPPDGDPATNLTQRLRRRGDEEAATQALDALLGAPFAEQPGGDSGRDWATAANPPPTPPTAEGARPTINRGSLRRAPVEPVRKGPRRAVLIGGLLMLTVLGGAGAAAVVFRSHGTTATAARPAGTATAAPTTASSPSPSAPTTQPATTPASSTSPAPATSSSAGPDPGAAAVAALKQLTGLRVQAYTSGDPDGLSEIYTDTSAAAAKDRSLLQGKSFRGFTFDLNDIRVQSATASKAVLRVTSTVGAYDVVEDGTVIAHADRQQPRYSTVTMTRTQEGWRIEKVTA